MVRAAEPLLFRVEHRGPLIAPPAASPAPRPGPSRKRAEPDPEAAAEQALADAATALAAAVALQRGLGLPRVTDGLPTDPDFAAALAGLEDGRVTARPAFPADHPTLARLRALLAAAGGPAKTAIPGPGALLACARTEAPAELREPGALAAAAGAVWGAALAALDAAGAGCVQIDLDADPDAEVLSALAVALAGRPAGLTVALALRALTPARAEALFALGADVHLLPGAPDLVGLLPRGRQRALIWPEAAEGAPAREALARAVDACARRTDPDQLGLAPATGFAVPDDAPPDARLRAYDDQRRTLDRMVAAADGLWGTLAG